MGKRLTYGELTKKLKIPMDKLNDLQDSPKTAEFKRKIGAVRRRLQSLVANGKPITHDTNLPPEVMEPYEELMNFYNQNYGKKYPTK